MKKVKRVLLLMAFACMLLLLSGCVELDIAAGIDGEHNATLAYTLRVDISQMEEAERTAVKNSIVTLGRHYEKELGFTVKDHSNSTACELIMTRTVPTNSYQEAFAALEEMLTDERMTVFMQVDMAAFTAENQQMYHLDAQLDIPKIIELSSIEEFPQGMRRQFEEGLAACTGSVTIVLPASQIEQSSHEAAISQNLASMTLPLRFDEETRLQMDTRLNLDAGGVLAQDADQILSQKKTYTTIFLISGGAGVLLLMVGIFAVSQNQKRQRAQKQAAQVAYPPPANPYSTTYWQQPGAQPPTAGQPYPPPAGGQSNPWPAQPNQGYTPTQPGYNTVGAAAPYPPAQPTQAPGAPPLYQQPATPPPPAAPEPQGTPQPPAPPVPGPQPPVPPLPPPGDAPQ